MSTRVALLLLSLTGGGVERSTLRLAREFVRRGIAIDLLVCRPHGELRDAVPDGVRLVTLADSGTLAGRLTALRAAGRDWPALLRPVVLTIHASRALRHLPALVRYLQTERPAALLAATAESIAQAYQFVATGNAELGFVALSQVVSARGGSRWIMLFACAGRSVVAFGAAVVTVVQFVPSLEPSNRQSLGSRAGASLPEVSV